MMTWAWLAPLAVGVTVFFLVVLAATRTRRKTYGKPGVRAHGSGGNTWTWWDSSWSSDSTHDGGWFDWCDSGDGGDSGCDGGD